MARRIIEAGDLPLEAKVYLKKNMFGKGYHIVYPFKNADGSINWFNLLIGGTKNFILIVLFIGLLLWSTADSREKVNLYAEKCELAMKEPVKFCDNLGYFNATRVNDASPFRTNPNLIPG